MASAQTGEAAKPFINFFRSATDVLLLLVQWLVMFTPVGAASLIASSVGGSSDIENTFQGVGFFVLAQVVGGVLLVLVLLPLIYFVFLRRNPFLFLWGASRAGLVAFVSCSSSVAMPEVFKCVESRHGVDKRVSSFVVPLAASINRDGSTMFLSLTAIYMAQLQGATSVDTILLITILSMVGSLAVPTLPSGSIVTVLMIVTSLEIPPANIGILLALEWFSDRLRTAENAFSHVICCVVTWQLCKGSLHDRSPDRDQTMVDDEE